jgi:CPA1 family monovalent cation:H+ antiporter
LIGFDTGIRADSLRDLVFFVILPVLVFEAAWHINVPLLRRWLAPILLISTAGMVLSAVIAGGVIYAGINHPAFPWVAALLTGAILAATDPAAVITQLRKAKAPEDLATLFEGESLFNDATAVVLFSLVLTMALTPEVMHGNSLGLFTGVFLGGAALGLVSGLVASILLLLIGRPAHTTIVLLFTAFGSFFLAEHIVNVSGIMAVVVAAIVVRGFLKEVEDSVASGLTHTWEWSSELLNSILFVIMGLTITLGMFETHWLAMIIAIVAALVSRLVAIGACGALTQLTWRKIPLRWQGVLVWGGLRGVIALALALALPVELDYWYTVQSMVFGVVLFSLLVQSTTSSALIRSWAPERRAQRRTP